MPKDQKLSALAKAATRKPGTQAKPPAPLEEDFHAVVAEFLDIALPSYAVFTTFPAGGGGKVRGANLKRMGLKAGWPDLQILVRASGFDSMGPASRFIGFEFKRDDGKANLTLEQTAMHGRILMAGGQVYTVRTLDEIYQHLTADEGMRLRCKPGA